MAILLEELFEVWREAERVLDQLPVGAPERNTERTADFGGQPRVRRAAEDLESVAHRDVVLVACYHDCVNDVYAFPVSTPGRTVLVLGTSSPLTPPAPDR